MKKVFVIIFLILGLPSFAKTITGEVKKELRKDVNQVYDSNSNTPIEGVVVKIPSKKPPVLTGGLLPAKIPAKPLRFFQSP